MTVKPDPENPERFMIVFDTEEEAYFVMMILEQLMTERERKD